MKYFALFAAICGLSTASLAYETTATNAVLIDTSTQTVLFEKEADAKMFPSSMSKLMTAYVVFGHIKAGQMKLEDLTTVSEKAWKMQGSKMYIQVGTQVKVEDLIRGMIIQSGNDACVALAEAVAGSEEAFVDIMNKKAAEIGLKGSHFMNATGWPDPEHYMTARDLSILAQHIIKDFPEFYHYYSETDFTYNDIKQGNRNPLLYYPELGVDGMKTGHTDIAGYGVTVSGKNPADGRRLVMVINGTKSMQARADEGKALLTYGYKSFKNIALAKKGETLGKAPVWLGKAAEVSLQPKEDVFLTLPLAEANKAKAEAKLQFNAPVQAPIKQGDELGKLVMTLPDGSAHSVPLVAGESVEKLGAFARILPQLKHLIFGNQPAAVTAVK